MQELQVPTRRVVAEIFTDRGERLSGGLFITDSPYRSNPIEQTLLVLNDERSFLPFDIEEPARSCSILNKAHITRVSLPRTPETEFADDDEEIRVCRLRLADGSALAGHLSVDTPWSLSRLLDKLNQANRFVRFITDSRVELVQTSSIVQVD